MSAAVDWDRRAAIGELLDAARRHVEDAYGLPEASAALAEAQRLLREAEHEEEDGDGDDV